MTHKTPMGTTCPTDNTTTTLLADQRNLEAAMPDDEAGDALTVIDLELKRRGTEILSARRHLEHVTIDAAHQARTAHEAGVPITTIARHLNVSRPTIYTWINDEED